MASPWRKPCAVALASRARSQQLDVSEGARLAFLAFHGVEAVGALGGYQRQLARFPAGVAAARMDLDQAQRKRLGSGFLCGLDCGAPRFAVLALAQLRLFAQSDQQHALGRNARDTVQDQRGAELAQQ